MKLKTRTQNQPLTTQYTRVSSSSSKLKQINETKEIRQIFYFQIILEIKNKIAN